MHKQGVILELRRKKAVVFSENGEYEEIERIDGMFVGQVVEYNKVQNINAKRLIVAISTAAVLVLMFFSYGLYRDSSKQVFAYVSLDAQSSMEFSIDDKNCVIELKPLNNQAKNLIKTLDVKGKNIDLALSDVIKTLKENGAIKYKNEDVIVLSTSTSKLGDMEDEKENKIDEINNLVARTVKSNVEDSAIVETIAATPEMRQQSVEADMSLGRYVLYKKAVYKGHDISLLYAKNSSIRELIEYSKSETVKQNEVKNAENSSKQSDINKSIPDKDIDIKDLSNKGTSQYRTSTPLVKDVDAEVLTNNHTNTNNLSETTIDQYDGEDRLPKPSPSTSGQNGICKCTHDPGANKHGNNMPGRGINTNKPEQGEQAPFPLPDLDLPTDDIMPKATDDSKESKNGCDVPKCKQGFNTPEIDEDVNSELENEKPPLNEEITRPISGANQHGYSKGMGNGPYGVNRLESDISEPVTDMPSHGNGEVEPAPVHENEEVEPAPVHENGEVEPAPVHENEEVEPAPVHENEEVEPAPVHENEEVEPAPVHENGEVEPAPVHENGEVEPLPSKENDEQEDISGRENGPFQYRGLVRKRWEND